MIIRGINKRRIGDGEQDRNDFVRRLRSLAVETKTAIYAWHLLVCSGRQGLAKFMRRLLTGHAVILSCNLTGLITYDRVFYKGESVKLIECVPLKEPTVV